MFEIKIEISLSERTLQTLETLAAGITAARPAQQEKEPEAKPVATRTRAAAPKPEARAQETAIVDARVVQAAKEADKAVPAAQAAQTEDISDATLRETVKATITRGVKQGIIKNLFVSQFGIECSPDCPKERRQELIDALNGLEA